MIYFDSAATTLQKPETVPAAVAEAIRTMTTPAGGTIPPPIWRRTGCWPSARRRRSALACLTRSG